MIRVRRAQCGVSNLVELAKGIRILSLSQYREPSRDGWANRAHERTLLQYLGIYRQKNPADWLDYRSCAEWVYNNTAPSSIRSTPAPLVFTEMSLCDRILDLAVGSQPSWAAAEGFRQRLESAKECLRKAQEIQARHYAGNRLDPSFEIGDMVLVDS